MLPVAGEVTPAVPQKLTGKALELEQGEQLGGYCNSQSKRS